MPGAGYAVRCLAVPVKASGNSPVGAWLSGYDPDGRDGRGAIEWTYDPAEAMIFATAEAAADCQAAVPQSRPVLADGTPNRPLAAYDLELAATPLPPFVAGDPHTDGRPLRERVQLYADLPPGIGSLLDLATVLLHRAFVSFRTGNTAVCDAFLNEGLYACGGLFEAKVAAMTESPSHLGDREWMAFIVHAAAVVPLTVPEAQAARPAPAKPAGAKQAPRAAGVVSSERLAEIYAEQQARMAAAAEARKKKAAG